MPDQNTPQSADDAEAAVLIETMNQYAVREVELSIEDDTKAASVRRLARELSLAIVDAVPASVERSIVLQKVREAYLWVDSEIELRIPQALVSTSEASA